MSIQQHSKGKPELKQHVPNCKVELGGISDIFLLPYANAGGTVILRSPPSCIPAIPLNQSQSISQKILDCDVGRTDPSL
jgi:hypothetical protein